MGQSIGFAFRGSTRPRALQPCSAHRNTVDGVSLLLKPSKPENGVIATTRSFSRQISRQRVERSGSLTACPLARLFRTLYASSKDERVVCRCVSNSFYDLTMVL